MTSSTFAHQFPVFSTLPSPSLFSQLFSFIPYYTVSKNRRISFILRGDLADFLRRHAQMRKRLGVNTRKRLFESAIVPLLAADGATPAWCTAANTFDTLGSKPSLPSPQGQ